MKNKMRKVPVRGTTAEEVLALWQAGKLYTDAPAETDEELLARCQREALAYAARVERYARDEWLPYIKEVWQQIVENEEFDECLVMRNKRQMNRYFVTGVVINLQMLGVYQNTYKVNSLQLHLELEGVTEKNGIYKNYGQYPVSQSQRKTMRLIIEKIKRV